MITTIAVIAAGGALGAVTRYTVTLSFLAMWGNAAPWATLLVNVLGSFLVGIAIVKFSEISSLSQELKLLCVTGFLGAFTTFSAFSLDILLFWERGEIFTAALYIGASVMLSILAVFFGFWFVRGDFL